MPAIARADTVGSLLRPAYLLEARITEAEHFIPRERLALSPQCGFASVEGGNPLTQEQQQAKLTRLVEVARRVWPA